MDLQTPRSEPHKLDKWTPEIEKLLADWAEISLCYGDVSKAAKPRLDV